MEDTVGLPPTTERDEVAENLDTVGVPSPIKGDKAVETSGENDQNKEREESSSNFASKIDTLVPENNPNNVVEHAKDNNTIDIDVNSNTESEDLFAMSNSPDLFASQKTDEEENEAETFIPEENIEPSADTDSDEELFENTPQKSPAKKNWRQRQAPAKNESNVDSSTIFRIPNTESEDMLLCCSGLKTQLDRSEYDKLIAKFGLRQKKVFIFFSFIKLHKTYILSISYL